MRPQLDCLTKPASLSLTRPICQQHQAGQAGERQDRPRVVMLLHPDRLPSLRTREPSFVRSFQSIMLPFSRLARPFLTRRSISCSIIGGGPREPPLHLPRLSAPDKTVHQSVNQSIRFFQKPLSKFQLEIHSPFRAAGQEESSSPSSQTARLSPLQHLERTKHSQQIIQFQASFP